MKKSASILLKALFSLAFLAIAFTMVRTERFHELFHSFDPLYFVLSFAVMFLMLMVSCWKWRTLLALQGHLLPFFSLIRIYLIGYFYTNLLPSSIGGDVVRSFYTGRRIGSQGHAAVSVFLERFTGILLLLVLVILAPLLRPGQYSHPLIWGPSLAAAGLLCLIIWLAFSAAPEETLRRVEGVLQATLTHLPLPGKKPLLKTLSALFKALRSFEVTLRSALGVLRNDRKALLTVIWTTLFFYFLTWVNVYFAFMTFAVRPPFWEMASVIPSLMLIFLIPISLGNLGLAEGAYVVYFRLIGLDPSAALIMGLFLRFKLIVIGICGLVSYLCYSYRVPVLKPQRSEREAKEAL